MISIILPNLNTPVDYILPRIDSIINQHYQNWECIVIDGFSTNGSWELILEHTKSDNRFKYYQLPPKGIYDAWNNGIKLSKRLYIYIATSDDIFEVSFFTHMVRALEMNLNCDLAHCCLKIIDENGEATKDQWVDWEKIKFYGDAINQMHIRVSPYDAIVHFGWSTVYSSIVQLLIRRTLFERIGYFRTDFGSISDYEWGLRATLETDTIHVPLFLASWRKHSFQATNDKLFEQSDFYSQLKIMAKEALCAQDPNHKIIEKPDLLFFNYNLQEFMRMRKSKKISFIIKNFFKDINLVFSVLFIILLKRKYHTRHFIEQQLIKRGILKNLKNVQEPVL